MANYIFRKENLYWFTKPIVSPLKKGGVTMETSVMTSVLYSVYIFVGICALIVINQLITKFHEKHHR
jgi:hypothetical protein